MQINNQLTANQIQPADRPLELKQGELYSAQIKERVSDTEAVIQIRGKEVKATFEGQVPTDDRVTVQVTGQKDQSVLVKTISVDATKASSTQTQPCDSKVLQSVGITAKDIPELKQSVQLLLDKGMPVTKEAVQELRDFFEKAKGTNADKLDTVKALVNKRLEVTQAHLRPIHEALHGRPLNEVLTDLAKEIDPEFDLAKNEQKEIERRSAQRTLENSQNQAVENRPITVSAEAKAVSSNPTTASTIKTEQPSTQVKSTDKQLSELLQRNREFVEKAPNLKQAIEKVRAEIVKNPAIDRELAQKVEKAAFEAEKLQSIGKERLTQALNQAENGLKQIEAHQQQQQTQSKQEQHITEQPTSETVKQVKELVQSEQELQKALEKVRNLISNNKNIDPEIIRNIKQMANQANQLEQAGRERITKVLEQVENAIKQLESNSGTPTQSQNQEQLINIIKKNTDAPEIKAPAIEKLPSEIIKQALTQIQKEPNLERVLNKIRQEISSSPNLDLKAVEKIEKAIEQSSQLLDKGRELGARQQITDTLTEIEQELFKTEPKPITEQQKATQDAMKQIDLNEQLQTLPLQSKNILVTKVTQKLAQATHDFRELKREITRNLDSIERLTNLFKKNAYPQAKQILQTTINKLDNAILKSDMMLFTDMKTEKQLMLASTQLAEAKKLLAKGNHEEAAKIVHEIKTLIDKINFKPSEQKVMHFVSKESMNLEQRSPSQQLLHHFDETARSHVRQEPSARQMYEMVRSLGLNHDSDLAKSLVFQKGGEAAFQQGQDQQNHEKQNIKAALLKLTQTGGDEAATKIAKQAEQALNNLTGQQLLSKSDSGNSLQSMIFNLPLLLGERPENLQVFVNSKNEGQQVDWENCNLYFLIETRRLGDVGIMLSTTERNLTITIKNDKPGFKQKMEPIAAFTKEKLQEIGYNVNSINFTRMSPVNSQPVQQQDASNIQETANMRPVFTEKGMDFKI